MDSATASSFHRKESLMDNFLSHYFYPVDVTPQNRVFSPEHIIISALIIGGILALISLLRERQDRHLARRILVLLGVTMLCLEIFRIGWHSYFYGFSLETIRFDWCNQICMVLPWIAIFRWEKAYPFVDVLSFIGGAMVLIYPLWVFYDYAGVHIMAIQSMISHGLMVAIPLVMPFSADYTIDFEMGWKPLAGLSLMLVVAKIMSTYLNVNYLLMKGPYGLPVIGSIPAPWHWIIVGPFFVAGILLTTQVLQRLEHWLTVGYAMTPQRRIMKSQGK